MIRADASSPEAWLKSSTREARPVAWIWPGRLGTSSGQEVPAANGCTPAELTTVDLQTEIRYRQDGEVVLVRTDEPTRVLAELTSAAVARGEELEGLQVRRPSLEEVYLALTAEEDEAAEVET